MDSKKRLAIQGIAALIQNADFRGFFRGGIYQGATKAVCVPGLNCYSCPGAVGACPIGSLQNSLSGMTFRFPYYVLGLMIFFGALLGRAICGFLCPFGLLQDLLNRIPFPKKIRTFKGDRKLRNLKYLVLIVLVVMVPIFVKLTPAFCKYICPLGAFYGPFNKVALMRLSCDKSACVDCGSCSEVCGMGVDPSKDPNSIECIRCGSCIKTCPAKALAYEFGIRKKEAGDPLDTSA